MGSSVDHRSKPQKRAKAPKWIASPPGVMRINVDGAAARSGKQGAVVAICRDNEGRYAAASVVFF